MKKMWPFKRKRTPSVEIPSTIAFTQVDTTARFDDNSTLAADDWIETVPLNRLVPDGESMGLPAIDATAEQIYSIASKLSRIRESLDITNDGVYCPICHIANVNLTLLRTSCSKCGNELLQFGWD